MDALARSSGYLLISGGGLMVALLVTMAVAQGGPAIYGFFLVTVLIGVGVLGLATQLGPSVGRFGQLSALAAGLGGLSVLVLGAYAIGTNQFVTDMSSDDPLGTLFALTSTAWMLGSLGFALALLRGRVTRPLGAWLVLAGTISAIVIGSLAATSYPILSYLSALPFGAGWVVIGLGALDRARVRAA